MKNHYYSHMFIKDSLLTFLKQFVFCVNIIKIRKMLAKYLENHKNP